MTEWKHVQDEVPEPFVDVFVVDPTSGVTIGYYDAKYNAFLGTVENQVIRCRYWMPIEYPKPPEGSVDTDWD